MFLTEALDILHNHGMMASRDRLALYSRDALHRDSIGKPCSRAAPDEQAESLHESGFEDEQPEPDFDERM